MHEMNDQDTVCKRFGVEPDYPELRSKLGVALNVQSGLQPLNGLRHPPEKGSNGWYIWAGTVFPDDEGFVPLHVEHAGDWNANIKRYLALPPGWRFLIANEYEDAWYDETLLVLYRA